MYIWIILSAMSPALLLSRKTDVDFVNKIEGYKKMINVLRVERWDGKVESNGRLGG